MISAETQKFIDTHGEWTAMSIKLADGSYTRRPAIDHRLRRLIQIAQDSIKKPLTECRVLDLACLEGHYAIEFALHGAEAVGIEGRQVSVNKCDYAKNALGLERAKFVTDDVRNLSVEKYGNFDIVICSGILYHLTASDAVAFIKSMSEVCNGILLLDTFVALSSQATTKALDRIVHGHYYFEHDEDDNEHSKSSKLWSSLQNSTSFWLTEPTVVNILIDCGFTSVLDVLSPTMPGNPRDRKTYLAVRGRKATIFSSEMTDHGSVHHIPEGINPLIDSSQKPKGRLFKLAKRVLPPSVKEAIKPALRAIKILPPDMTPDFQKKSKQDD